MKKGNLKRGQTSLAESHPHIAAEWDYEKNGDLTPDDVATKCNKKVFWICPNNHSYETRVFGRINCASAPCKKCKLMKNSFAVKCPDFVHEWSEENELSAEEVAYTSRLVIKWKCNAGHEWESTVMKRSGKKSGVPCAECKANNTSITKKRKLKPDQISLAESHPHIAAEWDYKKNGELTPNNISRGCHERVWWKCKRNHEWNYVISTRTARNIPCQQCKQYEISLAYNYPELLDEWDYDKNDMLDLDATIIAQRSNTYVHWKCAKGHEWSSMVRNRTGDRNAKCMECRKINYRKENSFGAKYPELLDEWNYEKNAEIGDPFEITAKAEFKVWWKCKLKGHEWFTMVYRRARGGGCPKCGIKKPKKGYSFLEKYPEISKLWDHDKNGKWTPSMISQGSNRIFWWKCSECKKSWKMRPNEIRRDTRCFDCRDRIKDLAKMRMTVADHNPLLIEEWHPDNKYKPHEVCKGSALKIKWICKEKGHVWTSEVTTRTRTDNSGCPKCSHKTYSKVAISWLETLISDTGNNIQHALNGNEKRIKLPNGKYAYVDGFCEETSTIYSFHGCWWHGHPPDKCKNGHLPSIIKAYNNKKDRLEKAYNRTIEREKQLKKMGYTVITMWECDYREKIKKKLINI